MGTIREPSGEDGRGRRERGGARTWNRRAKRGPTGGRGEPAALPLSEPDLPRATWGGAGTADERRGTDPRPGGGQLPLLPRHPAGDRSLSGVRGGAGVPGCRRLFSTWLVHHHCTLRWRQNRAERGPALLTYAYAILDAETRIAVSEVRLDRGPGGCPTRRPQGPRFSRLRCDGGHVAGRGQVGTGCPQGMDVPQGGLLRDAEGRRCVSQGLRDIHWR